MPEAAPTEDALAAIARLRRIAACAAAGEALGEDGEWLADALAAYLEHADAGVSLEQAFAIDTPRGALPWWRRERLARRDAALRAFAHAAFPKLKPHAQGAAVLEAATRYGASGWKWDCVASELPRRIAGTPRAHLWHAMQAAPLPSTAAGVARAIGAHKLKCPVSVCEPVGS